MFRTYQTRHSWDFWAQSPVLVIPHAAEAEGALLGAAGQGTGLSGRFPLALRHWMSFASLSRGFLWGPL